MGCDLALALMRELRMMFQSTHPHGVRQSLAKVFERSRGFNPRTHMGCDLLTIGLLSIPDTRFNPRTHMGCDLIFLFFLFWLISFNPRTHMGCDSRYFLLLLIMFSFNPRTHMGCDIRTSIHQSSICSFNPRTHMGCDVAADSSPY